MSAATLLMGLIKADQDIRDGEVEAAYTYLNSLGSDEPERPWAPGDNATLGRTNGTRLSEALGALRYSPEEDRMDLMEALWHVAAADGEIHAAEEEFIDSAAEALDLPHSVVRIVRPAFNDPKFTPMERLSA
jgi:uncharacterized tellurite resistance protein B-like protein